MEGYPVGDAPNTILRSRQFGTHNHMTATDHLTVRSSISTGRNIDVRRDCTVGRNLILKDSDNSSQLYQEGESLECYTQQLNIRNNQRYIRSKGLTGTQGLGVGVSATKDMEVGESEETLYAAQAPNNIGVEEGSVVCTFWNDWGHDVYDDWGHFYIFNVSTNQYYFPQLVHLNLPDGDLRTEVMDAFGKVFTIIHGWCAQGIYKFDVSCDDSSFQFIFGAYGDMGSDDETINDNYTYTLGDTTFTLYYNRNIEEGDLNERLYSYFIPYELELNRSKTYVDSVVSTDELSLYSVPVRKGITVYFAKGNDVREWVINDLQLKSYVLQAHGDTNIEGGLYVNGAYLVPPGTIVSYISSNAPPGWLLCDGSEYVREDYPDLYRILHDTFGHDGSSFFVPDLRGRTIVGSGTGVELTPRTVASTGGAETHTLSTNELPSHSHTGTTSSDGSHTHTHNANGGNDSSGLVQDTNSNTATDADNSSNEFNVFQSPQALTINSAGTHTHTFTTDSTGSGNSHNNMPPFLVLSYIIKT